MQNVGVGPHSRINNLDISYNIQQSLSFDNLETPWFSWNLAISRVWWPIAFSGPPNTPMDRKRKLKKPSRPVTEATRILGAPGFLAMMFLSMWLRGLWCCCCCFFFPLLIWKISYFFSLFDISNVAPLLTFWLVDVSVCRLKELQASDQVWFQSHCYAFWQAKHNPFHEKQVHFG